MGLLVGLLALFTTSLALASLLKVRDSTTYPLSVANGGRNLANEDSLQ